MSDPDDLKEFDDKSIEEIIEYVNEVLEEILSKDKKDPLIAQNPDHVVVKRNDGKLLCKKCLNNFPQAEPNQDDGSFICYSCRTYG